MTNKVTLTYQTRPQIDESQDTILSAYSQLLNKVERSLYAEKAKGKATASCKNIFLKQFGVTARQFNACKVSLEGKVAAARASQKSILSHLQQKIESLDKQMRQLEKKASKHFIVHQKQRRKAHLLERLKRLQEDNAQGHVHLCFGGKKLFRAQFHLEKNGFSSHEQWHRTWEAKRNNEFFVLGSKDETSGNQTCVAKVQPNGQLHLYLRLPRALEERHGKYMEIKNIAFAYGHDAILAGLQNKQALCYRFKKDEKGWRVFVSLALAKPQTHSKEAKGAIGIDLNSDHIACVETDRFGNPIFKQTFSWICYGKSRNQLKALTAEVCKKIVEKAEKSQKPIVIEALDFQKKKLLLKEKNNRKHARFLSSFAYGLFFHFLIARAFKHGIKVHRVNPAFTSVIGRINYARRYGLSIHLAAALCIARRHQKFSETPSFSQGKIPDGKGGHVAFVLPVRNRTKHVWHFWSQVKKKLTMALVAHFRAIIHRSLSPLSSTLEIASSRSLPV
jgi:IS605 OrfB family transposase